jgi:hypothetical protein
MKKNIYNGKIINLMMVIGLLIFTQTSSFSMESQNDSNFGSQKQTVDDQDITPEQPVDAQDITPQQTITTPQGLPKEKPVVAMGISGITTHYLLQSFFKKTSTTPGK